MDPNSKMNLYLKKYIKKWIILQHSQMNMDTFDEDQFIFDMKELFTIYDYSILDPDDICYIRWFHEYETSDTIEIDLSRSDKFEDMDLEDIESINQYLSIIITRKNFYIRNFEIVDFYLNSHFLNTLKINKTILYFSFEYSLDEYMYDDSFYKMIEENDTIQYISAFYNFNIDKIIHSLYKNKRLKCFENRLSTHLISMGMKEKKAEFFIERIPSLPNNVYFSDITNKQFYLIEGTRVYSQYYLVTKL